MAPEQFERGSRRGVVHRCAGGGRFVQIGEGPAGEVQGFDEEYKLGFWELFPLGTDLEDLIREEEPQPAPGPLQRLAARLDEVLRRREYRDFVQTPEANLHHEGWYVLEVALPIGLNVVKQRLENRYYRTLHAAKYDIELIASNAQTFNGEEPLTQVAAALRDELLEALPDTALEDLGAWEPAGFAHLAQLPQLPASAPTYLSPERGRRHGRR
ncbi:hypothetical protein CYMTET_25392 [Cymbomonas tetramitiformis]|uniref:Bromo domain-containing protein n=1 Tax=Cymbomonas tetramitiformis TaxID=36881 RepID=A0AAE0FTU5_9CHLO|nr:hypothetical protein CYMTET_25392 [Cymbomonas tetramitiformis]